MASSSAATVASLESRLARLEVSLFGESQPIDSENVAAYKSLAARVEILESLLEKRCGPALSAIAGVEEELEAASLARASLGGEPDLSVQEETVLAVGPALSSLEVHVNKLKELEGSVDHLNTIGAESDGLRTNLRPVFDAHAEQCGRVALLEARVDALATSYERAIALCNAVVAAAGKK